MQATHHQQHQLQSVFIQPTSPPQPPPVVAFQLTQPIDSAWQSSQTPAPAIHPALATPPVVLAGGKRKLSDDFSSSNPRTSALDALRKRQRRFRSASSLSDSDDDKDAFDSPRTPAVDDEAMEWTPESTSSSSTALTAAGLGPNQVCIAHFILSHAESLDISLQPASSPHLLSFPPPSSLSSADDLDDLCTRIPAARLQSLPPWRAPSPSESIHRLELLREARAPVVTTYASSFSQSPFSRDLPPSKAVPMVLHTRDDEYVFTVELPGYNIDGITVSCKRGNVVTVVADIWHLPRESCHQWDITFDADVNTSQLRAMMDRSSNVLTLIAKRYRRFVPIEYQVERKQMQQPAAFHS